MTLLEVLAAVAVLGLVYSILATAGIQGLRLEGDAARRLRASLLADRKLAEIEALVATGQTPELGQTESEEEDFLVSVSVEPLDLDLPETKASERARERLERAVGGRARDEKPPGSFLRPEGKESQSLLRRVDVSVAWAEGEGEQAVKRTTYALDAAAAAPLLEILTAAAEREKEEALQQAGRRESEAAAQSSSATATSEGSQGSAQDARALPGAAPEAEAGGAQ